MRSRGFKATLAAILSVLVATAPMGAQAQMKTSPSATVADPSKTEAGLIEAMLKGSAEARDAACDHVIAHPDAINPIYLYAVSLSLWKRGDRARATFWFYIAQVRSRAWINADKDTAPLRGALNQQIGALVNPWVGSDLEAWYDIAGRALAYEKKIPLYPGRPSTLTPEQWQAVVGKARQDNDAQFQEVFGGLRKDPQGFAEKRRGNGLQTGPLQDAGSPLPADWR